MDGATVPCPSCSVPNRISFAEPAQEDVPSFSVAFTCHDCGRLGVVLMCRRCGTPIVSPAAGNDNAAVCFDCGVVRLYRIAIDPRDVVMRCSDCGAWNKVGAHASGFTCGACRAAWTVQTCPHCESEIAVDPDRLVLRVKCAACRGRFRGTPAPAPSGTVLAAAEVAPPAQRGDA